jgi:NADPH-dependent 7-cyano-7-deazaguanine reductase QueF-like protein
VNIYDDLDDDNLIYGQPTGGRELNVAQLKYIYEDRASSGQSIWHLYESIINQKTQYKIVGGKRAIDYDMQQFASEWDRF